jgi:YgiT-type zinc finger domain-containing protein
LEEEEKKMKPFEKCPICGGELEQKKVEKLLRGGKHTAVLRINAEVCTHCGERLYAQDTVRYFEQIRNKLRRQELSEFQPLGQSFEVTDNFHNKSSVQA